MNVPDGRVTALQKVTRFVEILVGLVIPAVFAGPAIGFGLLFGFWGTVISLLHLSLGGVAAQFSFFLPALGGLLGLASVAVLLFRRRNLTSRAFAFCVFGLCCGVVTALYLLLPPAHPIGRFYIRDNKAYWTLLFAAPALIGLRRLLLRMREPRD
jgi:hypothetical protein